MNCEDVFDQEEMSPERSVVFPKQFGHKVIHLANLFFNAKILLSLVSL